MGNGMTIYVTLPGFYKQEINIPTDATVPDLCREIFDKTGVALFNGFGFKGQSGSVYVPTKAGVITNAKVTDVEANDSITAVDSQIFLNAIVDADAGTVATLASLNITHGEVLTFFSLADGDPADQQASQFAANS